VLTPSVQGWHERRADETPPLILLVEDHPANILVSTALFDQLGYRYEIARNGQEAIDRLAQVPFDIVLMDIQMPVLDGYETTRRIRRDEKRRAVPPVPIVGITAHVLAGIREHCLQAGMDDYIAKPFDPAQLRGKIQASLRRHASKALAKTSGIKLSLSGNS
jgi:CheY-like chemotaxis protein